MRCIIVDDEPIAHEGLEKMIKEITPQLELVGSFESAESASEYIKTTNVDLIFLDIEMPEINGLDFARNIPKNTLIIFTTAYSEYALDSYDVDAVDYIVKPINPDRFRRAVDKAITYHALLIDAEGEEIEANTDFIFVKSERRYFKVDFDDILLIEGLKDYVIIHTNEKRIITKMYVRSILDLLPQKRFLRVNKSYIVNLEKIDSFDNNDIYIKEHEIAIGKTYQEEFYKIIMSQQKI
ncbi:LytTR family DNA-binding domain-containing protein [Dysgonomonas sp. Marseille-P4361]|uniref:LytR/AlgR family response regulator transcription factor n=1 Tax=Dysgonomonas sp. Marseille-P4361 TaxID=2161820 RepID=UPI000D55CD83|nr:LytTR family DNA-binding domain-containing protein [Dysgonomonas sp. Marseille-P4361]